MHPRLLAANRYAKEMGYKIETRHGVQFYCRTTAPLGSRLTQKQCLTVDGLTQAGQTAEQNNVNFQQNSSGGNPDLIRRLGYCSGLRNHQARIKHWDRRAEKHRGI